MMDDEDTIIGQQWQQVAIKTQKAGPWGIKSEPP